MLPEKNNPSEGNSSSTLKDPKPSPEETPKEDALSGTGHSWKYLIPIVATLVISSVFAWITYLATGQLQVLPFDPSQFQGDQATPAVLNTALYVGIALIAAFSIIYLLRRQKIHLIRIIFIFALAFTSTVVIYLILNSLGVLLNASPLTRIILIASSPVYGLCLTYFVTSLTPGSKIRNLATIVIGSLIGAFLGPNIPTWTILLLLVALAIYDIYAVKQGPIKEMVETLEETEKEEGEGIDIPMLTYATKEWEIGIGDLAFYSAFTDHVLIYFGLIGGSLVSVGIIIGALATL
ncbi:MAG: presenilin family intramembrane aspartyl protease, partial [Candidatus Ranarchaeia archaeon]